LLADRRRFSLGPPTEEPQEPPEHAPSVAETRPGDQ
jgi:hypothetical protein